MAWNVSSTANLGKLETNIWLRGEGVGWRLGWYGPMLNVQKKRAVPKSEIQTKSHLEWPHPLKLSVDINPATSCPQRASTAMQWGWWWFFSKQFVWCHGYAPVNILTSPRLQVRERKGTVGTPYPILQLERFYTLIPRSQVLGNTFPYNSWQAGLLAVGGCYHLQRYGAYWQTEWWKDTPCCLKTFLSRPKSAWKQTPKLSLPLSNPGSRAWLTSLGLKLVWSLQTQQQF